MRHFLLYCAVALALLPAAILSIPQLSPQVQPTGISHMQQISAFVEKLVRTEFDGCQVNLIEIRRDYQDKLDNTVRDQLLQQGNSPVSIIEPTKQLRLHSYEILHMLSPTGELNIFFVTHAADGLGQTLLPDSLKMHHNFNVIFNWDPAMTTSGRSLLWKTPWNEFKFKLELIPVNRNTVLQSICFYCNDGQPKLVELGYLTCPRRQGHVVPRYTKTALFQDYTRNFHGRPVAVCAGSRVPTLHNFMTYPNGTIVPLTGIQVPILFMLEQKLNFEINMTLDKAFGVREANGSFSGLIGQVESGQVEIGLAAVITMDRLPVVEFANANNIQVAVFSTARPSSGLRWQAVFQSLSLAAWAVLFVICAGLILPLYISISLVHQGRRRLSGLETSYQCFDFLYRTILEQGVEDRRLSFHPSGQILLVFWMFFSILISNVYKSRLVSVMVSPLHDIVPNNFEELAMSDYRIYIQHDGGSLTNYIRATQSLTFRKISRRMILEKSIYKCIEFSLKPKTACITYRDSLTAVGNKNFTDKNGNLLYRKAPETAFFFPVSFVVRKNALIKDTIHSEISRIIDTGMARHAQDTEVKNSWTQGKQWARSGKGPKQVIDDSVDGKLTLQHLQGVFLMLLVSIVLACGLFAIERSRIGEKILRKRRKVKTPETFGRVGSTNDGDPCDDDGHSNSGQL